MVIREIRTEQRHGRRTEKIKRTRKQEYEKGEQEKNSNSNAIFCYKSR